MAMPPVDDKSIFILVLGPASIIAILAALGVWLKNRSRKSR